MCKSIFLLSGALLIAIAPAPVAAQSFDTSGTASLSGQYLFRYVNFFNDSAGNLIESCSLTGVITFDGQGTYTTSNTQLFDSYGTGGAGYCASLGGGTYGVQSNGMAQLDNPLYPATLYGAFSQPVVIASSTEDFYFDLFIAVQAPAASASNSILSGNYTVGTLDFLNSDISLARQGAFNLSADGNGNIGALTVTGSAANLGSGDITETVSGSTYSLSGAAGGAWSVPGIPGDQTQIISGQKVLYVSADGNYFLGGSASGSDMIFGFRAPSGTSTTSMLNGTYFLAGMDANLYGTPFFLDAFYGSISTNGDGNLIWHERFDDVVDELAYDQTFDTPVALAADGSYFDGTYYYFAGANGSALMLLGSGLQFSLNIGIKSPPATPTSSVWINPVGIVNAATYAPITNAYAPGELVDIYGVYPVSLDIDKVLPIPMQLNGVQVFVNGQSAPVLVTASDHISAWIPYEIAGDYFATFQVVVNDVQSNLVTVYVDYSAPGIYSLAANGLGEGAILHANYTKVTDSSPAVPGETVLLFMNGLGTVTPSVGDGVAASSSPLSYSDEFNEADIFIDLDDGVDPLAPTTVTFAGLAPGYAGLYQVNFTLPTAGLENTDVYIAFNTFEAVTELATIAVSGFPQSLAKPLPGHRPSRPARRTVAARTRHSGSVKDHRRALPARQLAQR